MRLTSKTLAIIDLPRFVVQAKVSDCWAIDGRPVRWQCEKLRNPLYPEWTGLRLVCVWLAVWIGWRRLGGGGQFDA